MSAQKQIYDAIEARGYVGDWTKDELIGRHVLKLIEEVEEAAHHVTTESTSCNWLLFLKNAATVARHYFDDGEEWTWVGVEVDLDGLKKEMVDCAVVLFSLAEVVGIDLIEAAVQKATADIARGVRSNGNRR